MIKSHLVNISEDILFLTFRLFVILNAVQYYSKYLNSFELLKNILKIYYKGWHISLEKKNLKIFFIRKTKNKKMYKTLIN